MLLCYAMQLPAMPALRVSGRAVAMWVNGAYTGGGTITWGDDDCLTDEVWPISMTNAMTNIGHNGCGLGITPYFDDVEPFYGRMADYVPYRTALSSAKISIIMADLAKKWGIVY